jgi:hypothetical protein
MTVFFPRAVAADGEVGLLREGSEQRNGVVVLGRGHLCTVLANERGPLSRSFSLLPELHCLHARCQVGEPYVVPVLAGELGLGDSSRRTTNGPDADALVLHSRHAEPYNADNHWFSS